jgi:hypothetical protein
MSKKTGRIIEICNSSVTGMKAFNNYVALKGLREHNTEPCISMNVFPGIPIVSEGQSEQEASIRVYMKTNVRVKTMILYYDFTTLAADIGGYIGMCLGISLIDLTITCNTALHKFVTGKLKQKYERAITHINAQN